MIHYLNRIQTFAVAALMVLTLGLPLAHAEGTTAANPCNPCAPKAANPCNPCAPKHDHAKMAMPANPCAPKVANPCNPCAPKAANPCAAKATK